MNEFNVGWNEALKLNYATFVHRCKFIEHKNTEAIRAMKQKK